MLLNKTKIVEIWTKFFISGNIESTKKADHISEISVVGGILWPIILLLEKGWQINAANYVKN